MSPDAVGDGDVAEEVGPDHVAYLGRESGEDV